MIETASSLWTRSPTVADSEMERFARAHLRTAPQRRVYITLASSPANEWSPAAVAIGRRSTSMRSMWSSVSSLPQGSWNSWIKRPVGGTGRLRGWSISAETMVLLL